MTLLGEGRVGERSGVDFAELFKRGDREEIGRDEEGEDAGVVGGAEGGMDESAGARGIAVAVAGKGIAGNGGGALETVRAAVLETLLFAESLHDEGGGVLPRFVEAGGVARGFPVAVREADRVAEGIDLPLALVQLGLHAGVVGGPLAAGGAVVEGVGVWIDQDAAGLAVDDAGEHGAQFSVIAG